MSNNTIENNKKKEDEFENRTFDTSSSGRLSIWKGAIKMGMENPIFGLGNRNIPSKYEEYFDEYEISNSLRGGNFHNIFITSFVSTGLVGVIAFCYVLFIIGRKFIFHVAKETDVYSRILLLPFFGILLGQAGKAIIVYQLRVRQTSLSMSCTTVTSLLILHRA